MKKYKKFSIVLLIITATVLLSGCVGKVSVPQVEEGRFAFSVTYEVDGEEKTYSGVYVCKFDGVLTTFVGSDVEWEEYIENEKEIDIPIQTNEEGVVYINFGFSPEYFMNDPDAVCDEVPTPNLFMIYHGSNPEDLNITSDEQIIADLGVKLIGYEYADPIENSFYEKISFSRFEPSIN